MTTSRTGTGKWKRVAKHVRNQARRQGLTHCPRCGVLLDWDNSRTPRSPEVDHVIPHSRGGKDSIENAAILCRLCNQKLGNKRHRPRPTVHTTDLDASPIW